MIRRLCKLTRCISVVKASYHYHAETHKIINWAKDHGAIADAVKIKKSPVSGYGLFTTRDVIKGDMILSLPMNLTIMVYPSDEEASLQVPFSHLPDSVIRLVVKFLRLQRDDPFFLDPYISALPAQSPNPSLMFQSVSLDDIYRDELEKIVQQYEDTVSFLRRLDIPHASEEGIRWALAVIQSRSFGNGMGQEMLVPLIDMMNHGDIETNDLFTEHPLANVTYGWLKSGTGTDPTNWSMIIKAKQTILEGEELFVSYGDHSNEYFLLFYGFVPLYNPRDEFILFHNLEDILSWYFAKNPDARGSITDNQLEFLKEHIKITGDMANIVKFNLCADGSISPIMIQFFKMLCSGSNSDAISWISKACQDQLSNSSTSLEADLQQLSNNNNFFMYQYAEIQGLMIEKAESVSGPSYGSSNWWVLVHRTMKKLLLQRFYMMRHSTEPS